MMKWTGLLVLAGAMLQAAESVRMQETWETGYTREDATGAHLLGYWKFDGEGDAALKDASGKGNDLAVQGAVLSPKGKFGGALESFPGFPVEDKRHAMLAARGTALNPAGAFTMEMWVAAKPEFTDKLRCYLLDKKYVAHQGYQWQLLDADKAGLRRMLVTLGFGAESRTFLSEPLKVLPGAWHHLAFTYDAQGTGRFFVDGQAHGLQSHPGFGAVMAGTQSLSVGDRLGSNYGGFPGFIDEVRLCNGVLEFERVKLTVTSDRKVWRRMETARPVEVKVHNLSRQPLGGASLELSWSGGVRQTVPIQELKPGAAAKINVPVNTSLRADDYTLTARLLIGDYSTSHQDAFKLMPRPLPRMPVVMWGNPGEQMQFMRDIGFTHCLGVGAEYGPVWAAGKPLVPEKLAETRAELDQALAMDVSLIFSASPSRFLEEKPENLRVGRDVKPYERQDIRANNPAFPAFFENVGRSVATAYGDHPAFAAALVNTEVRDASTPSFNPEDIAAYRAFANADIPAEVQNRWGVDWTKLKDFPKDRVIPDDHPILKYYRWFWTVGDGWNNLHSALSKGFKSRGKPGFWTFFDPAVRQPSISGAGGSVDVLSHWTYTYPDPQRIGLCADQLFAMSAASGRNQKVMKMTQLIWYRSQTAPIGDKAVADTVAWQDHDPDAAYITISPMHLREALWTKLSRPIQGIMYHGWQSLVQTDSGGGYRHTNPHTQHELKRLIKEVVEPLAPTLLQVPGEKREVALLESFTSQMFARRGGYGSNNNWSADLWMALQHAQVSCDILFEETLIKAGLRGRKVLVMPECDVLTKPVVEAIAQWQAKGGKIVADEFLCPALKADVVVKSIKRVKKADQDKAALLKLAGELGPQMQSLGILPRVKSDSPEVLTVTRKYGEAMYVFAINDRREFGHYVGQHQLVMENGLPSKAFLTAAQPDANVYDLTTGRQVIARREGESTVWSVDLAPCDGRVFLVTPKALMHLEATVPEVALQGERATVNLFIKDGQGNPVSAVVPVSVTLRDTNGRLAEGSGYHAAVGGKLSLPLDIATNDDPGTWTVHLRELASGMETTRWMRVTAPGKTP